MKEANVDQQTPASSSSRSKLSPEVVFVAAMLVFPSLTAFVRIEVTTFLDFSGSCFLGFLTVADTSSTDVMLRFGAINGFVNTGILRVAAGT